MTLLKRMRCRQIVTGVSPAKLVLTPNDVAENVSKVQ